MTVKILFFHNLSNCMLLKKKWGDEVAQALPSASADLSENVIKAQTWSSQEERKHCKSQTQHMCRRSRVVTQDLSELSWLGILLCWLIWLELTNEGLNIWSNNPVPILVLRCMILPWYSYPNHHTPKQSYLHKSETYWKKNESVSCVSLTESIALYLTPQIKPFTLEASSFVTLVIMKFEAGFLYPLQYSHLSLTRFSSCLWLLHYWINENI